MKAFFEAISGLLGLFIYAITFLAIASAGIAMWFSYSYERTGPLGKDQTFTVHRGQGVSTIATELEKQGMIYDALTFNIAARLHDAETTLKAGEYNITARSSTKNILNLLKSGKVILRQFTIPEGLTSYEIVRELNTIPDMTGTLDLDKDIPPEGSLLPETYSYQKGESRKSALDHMQKTMTAAFNDLWETRAEDLPYKTKEEALTMASIIEKETGAPGEHAMVAGVFINRLNKGMLLQTDPTVIYAITGGKHKNQGLGPLGRRLLKKDLEIDSPYNTYKNAGLPPGPIANPGLESIKAALNPAKHNYLYFVADGSGGHAFAKTLAEHNRNVEKWRKIRSKR